MLTLVERLVAIGFTEYEAKAYVALLKLGPETGYQIAKASRVPRSTIYEVLAKLVARGAAVTQSSPEQVRYLAIPPERLLDRLHRDFQNNLDALAEGMADLTGSEMEGNIWTLSGRENLFAYARQMIARALDEVVLVVGDDDEMDQLLPVLQEAKARGTSLLLLSPTPYDAIEIQVKVHPQGMALRQAVGHGFTLIVDGREAIVGEVDRSESAIWTTNGYVVAWMLGCLKRDMGAH